MIERKRAKDTSLHTVFTQSRDALIAQRSNGPMTQWLNDSMARWLNYFSLAPFGTSSLNVTSTGFPPSPTDAATIMPLDSMPRSLRG